MSPTETLNDTQMALPGEMDWLRDWDAAKAKQDMLKELLDDKRPIFEICEIMFMKANSIITQGRKLGYSWNYFIDHILSEKEAQAIEYIRRSKSRQNQKSCEEAGLTWIEPEA